MTVLRHHETGSALSSSGHRRPGERDAAASGTRWYETPSPSGNETRQPSENETRQPWRNETRPPSDSQRPGGTE